MLIMLTCCFTDLGHLVKVSISLLSHYLAAHWTSPLCKTTSIEDELDARRPCRKMTWMEDDINAGLARFCVSALAGFLNFVFLGNVFTLQV